ncbi:hypothetical protein VMUT_0734 [Vulcanisaeta moutnovskia 768-28]|jgi:Ni,Fe-hydrogenase I cytochrome b subunit|uniref:Uncharacterized protein n=1 Tax=Vulcanisaeta moutnovskia (strain 768-28) TaxID=985053 RepID=F0QW21_VULM7|nr:hypothetical protein VMUT_0734 [Vulcanisaeta moutnovskia 768-28]
MIRYLLTSVLILMILIMIIMITGFILNILYLTGSVSNYAVVIMNGTRRFLNIS